MPLFLSNRNETLVEWMDRDDCDRTLLQNTYRQFTRINKLLSGWKGIYKSHIKPVIKNNSTKTTILDIGCGGGDILRLLDSLAKADGFQVDFTGIDPDRRSIEFLESNQWPENITFLHSSSGQLSAQNREFDIVISNHLMHHLSKKQLQSVCADAEKLTSKIAIFCDIERSDIGYASFGLIAPLLFRKSYIVTDGLISVRKSYRKDELQHTLPISWRVRRKFPFRLLATYRPNSA